MNRASGAGAIRPDFDHSDLYMLTDANSGLLRSTPRTAPLAWRRLGDCMFQAFREPGSEPLTSPARVWTDALAVSLSVKSIPRVSLRRSLIGGSPAFRSLSRRGRTHQPLDLLYPLPELEFTEMIVCSGACGISSASGSSAFA